MNFISYYDTRMTFKLQSERNPNFVWFSFILIIVMFANFKYITDQIG